MTERAEMANPDATVPKEVTFAYDKDGNGIPQESAENEGSAGPSLQPRSSIPSAIPCTVPLPIKVKIATLVQNRCSV